MGYAIVVDTSVARSAGTSGKSVPEACRQTLLAILNHGHRVAMSEPIRNEWMKPRNTDSNPYASLFSLHWLTQMQSRGRVVSIILEEDSPFCRRCMQALQQDRQTISSVDQVKKDFHLVETALKADRRVISLDNKIVHHLSYLKGTAEEICSVIWVDPVNHQAEAWLRGGAPDIIEHHIC